MLFIGKHLVYFVVFHHLNKIYNLQSEYIWSSPNKLYWHRVQLGFEICNMQIFKLMLFIGKNLVPVQFVVFYQCIKSAICKFQVKSKQALLALGVMGVLNLQSAHFFLIDVVYWEEFVQFVVFYHLNKICNLQISGQVQTSCIGICFSGGFKSAIYEFFK
jgi:hypothetical protein